MGEATNQYDTFGNLYKDSKLLPSSICEDATVHEHVGDLQGLRVLDLACGNGDYSRKAVLWGAAHVTAVDLSPGMIEGAKALTGDDPRIQYSVGDCLKPLDVEEGSYDVVLAVWLLNYAKTEEDMMTVWSNVVRYLKPGGRFVGIFPSFTSGELDDWYGVTAKFIGKTPEGVVRKVTLHTTPEITFSDNPLNRSVIEKCAKSSGLLDFQVHGTSLPKGAEENMAFWEPFYKRPGHNCLTAIKST